MKRGVLICEICGRARDDLGQCPTPTACERFKRPHRRHQEATQPARQRESDARRDRIGIGRVRLPSDIPDPDWKKVGVG